MEEMEVPKLTWAERYRRMLEIAYGTFISYNTQLKEKYGEEIAINFSKNAQGSISSLCSKKLIKHYSLNPTVEDVVKLMKLYSCEVWGFGAEEYVGAYLKSPQKGVFVNKVCRAWEKRKKDFGAERSYTCHLGCEEEYSHLAHVLAPQVKVRIGKAFPKGDDCCEFIVEEPN